jgi:hypothetical protein
MVIDDSIADMAKQPLRKQIFIRHKELVQLRDPRMRDWIDLNDYILPRRLRYLNQGKKNASTRNPKIINGKATRAVRVLESGMMAGMTSPARPWARLITDPRIAGISRVRDWLGLTGPKVLQMFNRSNIYKCLPKYYGDLAVFGTAAIYMEADPQDLIRGYVLPLGQYAAAVGPTGRVNTVYREFEMTVLNLIKKFGPDRVSRHVRDLHKRGAYDHNIRIIHAVEPREVRDPAMADHLNMPWRSVWLEKDGPEEIGVLYEGGYRRFPFMVARWEVTDDAEDAYGDGPGIDAIGDAIAIQLLEKRKAQGVDKIYAPPMTGPSSLRPQQMSLVPNGFTPVDVVAGGQQFKPSVEINYAAPKVTAEVIKDHEQRINEIFMADLWLMMASSDRREITAREVDERHEEKMIQLGPVVDRLNDELIDPLFEFTIARLIETKQIPPMPPELMEAGARVDNISILGQAQKLVGTVGLERLAGFVGNIAAVDKSILDNLDRDQMARNYADMLGVSPDNVTSEEAMAQARAQRAQAEQAQAMAAGAQPMQQAAQAAKVMSETDVNGDSALSRLLGSIGAGT